MKFEQSRFLEQVRAWLAGGNDVNAYRTEQGWTLLHLAAEYQDISAIRELVAIGLNPNVPDKAGWTALHLAVDADIDSSTQRNLPLELKTVRELVALGANPNVRDLEGKTPRDVAARYGAEEVAAYDKVV